MKPIYKVVSEDITGWVGVEEDGFHDNLEDAEEHANSVKAEHPNWVVWVTATTSNIVYTAE